MVPSLLPVLLWSPCLAGDLSPGGSPCQEGDPEDPWDPPYPCPRGSYSDPALYGPDGMPTFRPLIIAHRCHLTHYT